MLSSPIITLTLTSLINVTSLVQKSFQSDIKVVAVEFALAGWLSWRLRQTAMAPWWGPCTVLLSQWTRLVPSGGLLVRGGPLGRGCVKLIEVVVAVALWRFVYQEWPPIEMGPLVPTWQACGALVLLSAIVNLVLQQWSNWTNSRGSHAGVLDMVEGTQGRPLAWHEQARTLALAFINAICEEVSSRWFWRQEFVRVAKGAEQYSNLFQAAVFGVAHYNGVPSGWTGVGLTFVYGGIMGLLQDYHGGLWLPILAHTVADYYIFAILVRNQQQQSPKPKRS